MSLDTRVRFTHWRRIILLLMLAVIIAVGFNTRPVYAANLNVSENFETFTGSGFSATPAAGQLDSDDWRVAGLDSGSCAFGASTVSCASLDYARGTSTGGVTTGGVYAFNTGSNVIFGLQPGATDVTPGTITLRVVNNSLNPVTQLAVSYEIWYRNDAPRTNTLNLAHSANDSAYTSVPALDFATPEAADVTPTWQSVTRNTTLTGLNIPASGGVYYIQWQTDDTGASTGARDELGIDDVSVSIDASETAPSVTSSTPADNATGVAVNANIDVTFSEAVNAAGTWFTISCATSGAHTAVVSGSSPTFTLNPDTDFANNEVCTVTIDDASVTDVDANDPPNTMAADYVFDFTTVAAGATATCGDPATLISSVQGALASTQMAGATVAVEAIVTGDYQGPSTPPAVQLNGFFLQEEDANSDGNAATSEGIFVFENALNTDVNVGDRVRVVGTVVENFNQTEISATSVSVCASGQAQPTAAVIDLPVVAPDVNAFYEPMEGMRVTYSDVLTVSEYFEMNRNGQVILYEGGRPYQYSHTDNTPTNAEYTAHLNNLLRRRVILDDDDNGQNALINNEERAYHPLPGGLSIGTQGVNFFRGGDTVSNLTGILSWTWNGVGGSDAWRIRPVPLTPPTFTPVNLRPTTPPAVGGNIRVASYNVLNFFTTIDTTSSNSTGPCGPLGTLDCRGADSTAELNRQVAKLNTALAAINADVFGLMEIQNSPTAAQTVANNLNTYLGGSYYAAVNTGGTGYVGTDAITVAIIYKTSMVVPVGAPAILDNPLFTDPNNTGTPKSRPAIAQTFRVISGPDTGAIFTVVVNHLKSKGSPPSGCPNPAVPFPSNLDCDQADGQGSWNDTRQKAAAYLVNTWIPSDPTGQGDPDFLLIGDMNSYAGEDPIDNLKAAGYTDLVQAFLGTSAYSYLFDGQLGYLDLGLSSPTMTPQVTGVVDWHINADENPLFDYNDDIRDTPGEATFEEEPGANPLYEVNQFRTSDHDPVIIGLDLNPTQYIAEPVGAASCAKLGAAITFKIRGMVAGRQYTVTSETRTPGNVWMIRQVNTTFAGPNGTQVTFKNVIFPYFNVPGLVGGDAQQTSWTVLPGTVSVIFTIVDTVTDVQHQTVFTYTCGTGGVVVAGATTGPVTNPLYNPVP